MREQCDICFQPNHNKARYYIKMVSTHKTSPSTWLVVGASRGIGLELTKQLLSRGDRVFATARAIESPQLSSLQEEASDRCRVLECDITVEDSIKVKRPPLASIISIYALIHAPKQNNVD